MRQNGCLAQHYVWKRGRNTSEGHTPNSGSQHLLQTGASSECQRIPPPRYCHHHSTKCQVKITMEQSWESSRRKILFGEHDKKTQSQVEKQSSNPASLPIMLLQIFTLKAQQKEWYAHLQASKNVYLSNYCPRQHAQPSKKISEAYERKLEQLY